MGDSEAAVFRFAPILRLAVRIGIRRDDLTFKHHRLDVEVIILTNGKEPDVLRAVLPIRLRATPLFAFPRDPVLRNEIFFTDALDCSRTAPVSTDVNRGRGFE